jgi:hypothetical protein
MDGMDRTWHLPFDAVQCPHASCRHGGGIVINCGGWHVIIASDIAYK